MRTIIPASLLFYILISSISLASPLNCYNTGYFQANSTYAKNRDLLFSSLASNVTANGGFYTTTIGQDNDKVYALVLCISNASAENCDFCVRSAIEGLKKACPNQTEAISLGGDPIPCIVRYAKRPFLGRMVQSPTDFSYKKAKLDTNLTEFNMIWTSLMNETVAKASMSSSMLKMATGIAKLPSKQKIYVLMQCTPDISQSSCSYCLQNSVTQYNDSSFATVGSYIKKPSCFFRWEVYPFYTVFSESLPDAPPPLVVNPSSPTTTAIRKDNKRKIKVIIIITVVLGAIAIAICMFCLWKQIGKYRERKGKGKQTSFPERKESYPRPKMIQGNLNQVKLQELPVFKLEKLVAATDNFDSAKKLGQGGFGSVYKGKLTDGLEIAVKRLSRESKQGQEEFMNEVVVISKLQHKNLVTLLGCCVEGEERMLVYEYMPNKSLDACLFDPLTKQLLNWKKRLNVVEGICRGLLYLHRDSRLKIIHRDLKASNILLDHELNPKISDFGMARIFGSNEDQANTRRVVGTYGYMSPEYAIEGRFSEKSDVFSFGVLLLEIMSGRKNTSFYGNENAFSLLTFTWKLWNEGNIVALVDPVISSSSFQVDVFRCIHVGLLCVQEFAIDRPTISTVISMLNSEIADLPAPKQPAFVDRKSYLDLESYQRRQKIDSVNNVTVTVEVR